MGKYKKSYKNNKSQISVPTLNDKFGLHDRSHSVSDIQYHFQYIILMHETITDNLPTTAYVNKTENRITFKIKTRHCPQFSRSETIKLLGSTKNKKTKDKTWGSVPHLQITEIVFCHYNIVNNDGYQESCIHLFLINCLVHH